MNVSRRQAILGGAGAVAALVLGDLQAHAANYSSELRAGQVLRRNERITSASGQHTLILQPDHNLVCYGSGRAIWSAGTRNSGADRLVMQGDGNLVLYAGGRAVWHTHTGGTDARRLVVQNDGNIVVYGAAARWASGSYCDRLVRGKIFRRGHMLTAKNRKLRLVLQGDQNLVAYDGSTPIWHTSSSGSGADRLVLQGDHNLVLYAGSRPVWHTYSSNSGADRLIMQGDRNLVLYAGSRAVWHINGGGSATPQGLDGFKSWALNAANWNSTTPAGNPGIDIDGSYGAQCADIGIAWSRQAGHGVGFDGWDTSSRSKPGWHHVSGTLANARPGDVVTRVGGIQHVVVVVGSPGGGGVDVVQQNPRSPHVKSYSTATSGVIWRLNQ